MGTGTDAAMGCPVGIQEARGALEKAMAAATAAACESLSLAKDMLHHAEAEHKGAGTDVKKHAEAVREARTAQGYAEEARLIAEKF